MLTIRVRLGYMDISIENAINIPFDGLIRACVQSARVTLGRAL